MSYFDANNRINLGTTANDRGPFVGKWTSIFNGFNSTDNNYVLGYAEAVNE